MNRTFNAPATNSTAATATSFDGGVAIQEGGGGNYSAIGDSTPFPDAWNDLWKLEEPLDWDAFLDSELLMKERSNLETSAVIFRTTASISVIASALLIVHVLRSHQGLSTTYHRLMFGLSISDILYSSIRLYHIG